MTEPVQGTADNPPADTGSADVDTQAEAMLADAVQTPEPPTEDTATGDTDAPKGKTYTESYVNRMRNKEALQRTKLKEAEDKHQAVLDSIAKALGVKGSEEVDPAKLTEQLTAAQAEARQLKVERAVERAARTHGADEALLTAVLAHQGKLTGFDPASDTFATDVDALVAEAVEANPRLKAETTAPAPAGPARSGGDFSAGSGAGQPISEAQLLAMSPEEVTKAFHEGKLAHLL